ncbi:putative N-acetyltransferase [Hyphodiscus hymeniophilus]|uniref:N-acetyltransferase n=1 Tax=Hyphodiscus hymeniophilus TaxID=353542 RepID=A0A9P6VSV5_9HELO|nr:putative N-acetyltransferase [Hyphodiscus hymeniophilus]
MAPVSNISTGNVTLEKKRSLTPDETTDEVRVLSIAEYEQAALSLAEAFAVDDVARYFLDTDDMASFTEEYKYKLHCDILRYVTAAHCYKGIVTTIGPDYDAVALWMPPGKNMDDLWTIIRSGMWRLWYKLSSEGKTRFYNEFLPLLHDTKHEIMGERDDESYYLVYLGSKPSARGKGYARKLIENMTERADLEGRAMYLESSAEANIGYYKKHAFAEKKVIALERGPKPIKMHIMVREPQAITEGSKRNGTVKIRAL